MHESTLVTWGQLVFQSNPLHRIVLGKIGGQNEYWLCSLPIFGINNNVLGLVRCGADELAEQNVMCQCPTYNISSSVLAVFANKSAAVIKHDVMWPWLTTLCWLPYGFCLWEPICESCKWPCNLHKRMPIAKHPSHNHITEVCVCEKAAMVTTLGTGCKSLFSLLS